MLEVDNALGRDLGDGRIVTYIGPLPTWEPDGLKLRDDKRLLNK